MKILLAEDEPVMLRTMEFRLKKDGHEILRAEDGTQALEKAELQNPDLIITDLNMPGASGLDLLILVRQKLSRTTPVIILSGSDEQEIRKQAFDLGANDYLLKPFSPNALSEMVKKYIP